MSKKRRAVENPKAESPLEGEELRKRLATLERYGRRLESREKELRAWVETLAEWEKKNEEGGAILSKRKKSKRQWLRFRRRE